MTPYHYRKSHCGDKTISRPSCLHNGISYTGKRTYLYWIGALLPNGNISVIFHIYQSAAFAWFDSLILVNPGKHWTSTPVPTVVIGMLPSDGWRFGFAFNKSFPTVYLELMSALRFVLKRCSLGLIQYKKAVTWQEIVPVLRKLIGNMVQKIFFRKKYFFFRKKYFSNFLAEKYFCTMLPISFRTLRI